MWAQFFQIPTFFFINKSSQGRKSVCEKNTFFFKFSFSLMQLKPISWIQLPIIFGQQQTKTATLTQLVGLPLYISSMNVLYLSYLQVMERVLTEKSCLDRHSIGFCSIVETSLDFVSTGKESNHFQYRVHCSNYINYLIH